MIIRFTEKDKIKITINWFFRHMFEIERNEWRRSKISFMLLDTVRMLMCIAMYADIIASINLNMFLTSLIMMFLHMNKNKENLWWFCLSLTLILYWFHSSVKWNKRNVKPEDHESIGVCFMLRVIKWCWFCSSMSYKEFILVLNLLLVFMTYPEMIQWWKILLIVLLDKLILRFCKIKKI